MLYCWNVDRHSARRQRKLHVWGERSSQRSAWRSHALHLRSRYAYTSSTKCCLCVHRRLDQRTALFTPRFKNDDQRYLRMPFDIQTITTPLFNGIKILPVCVAVSSQSIFMTAACGTSAMYRIFVHGAKNVQTATAAATGAVKINYYHLLRDIRRRAMLTVPKTLRHNSQLCLLFTPLKGLNDNATFRNGGCC